MDVQVLFLRLDTIGRESTAQQQAVAQGQQVAGKELAEQSQARARQVSRTEELPDGSQGVKEDETEEEQGGNGNNGSKSREHGTASSDGGETFRDPDLGTTIDVSG